MAYIKLDREKCKGCMLCISVCPKGQLKEDKGLNKKGIRPVRFLDKDCSGCAFCAIICPDCCIEVYK
ncbi:MAG: hypothetical protein A3G37_01370 [Omnitrophica WOR_2 bacterium RIFCSPLOWO2_12_FULL_46_30]|nr:MAG: hypothetical protein A3D27_03125 [Omnitrophica WOR_2 bacterium RIFCSPHIGHO2_02_FULL_46_37]OGX42753.1 MAG: hypothetical protein A3H41_00460 [Omnitrophica WOR_2 bacterium RIFCSPLOWO2_02_FULL_45_28]OGX51509.1 MAG: hypothetical protein A3G37_01370 [Omnitrophica WOR_2 bacterium RIFCSPLOWO2_12_FULL_46_30]